ncbi:MAG: P-type conjugative transfer protein VirB9 [Candidatus Methylumidiphilus sp.]
MNRTLVCAVLLSLLPSVGTAEITPRQGDYDPRVRIVDYNPSNVVKLSTFYGVSTHVQFGEGENIHDVAVGDDQAWTIVPRGLHLFIKPKAQKADTNLTVITDKRAYEFMVYVEPRPLEDVTAWKNPKLIYALTFRYPEDETGKLDGKLQKQRIKEKLANERTAGSNSSTARSPDYPLGDSNTLDGNKPNGNLDYWVAGSQEISPTSAKDDGRFTYLTFTNNRDMPAIYTVDAEGNEALVNTNVEGNTIIVHRVVPKLTLRKGIAVACLLNKSFNFDGGRDNTTGTVSADVKRVVKGQAQ